MGKVEVMGAGRELGPTWKAEGSAEAGAWFSNHTLQASALWWNHHSSGNSWGDLKDRDEPPRGREPSGVMTCQLRVGPHKVVHDCGGAGVPSQGARPVGTAQVTAPQ